MKKGVKMMIAIMAVVMTMMLMMIACDDKNRNQGELEIFNRLYQETSSATKIERKIEIKEGGLTKSISEKTLTKTESGYDVTEKERLRGELGEEGLDSDGYKSSTKEYKVGKSDSQTPTISFDEENFAEISVENGVLKATVNAEKAKAMFGLEDEGEMSDIRLEVRSDGTHISAITLSYTDGSDSVSISVSFTY